MSYRYGHWRPIASERESGIFERRRRTVQAFDLRKPAMSTASNVVPITPASVPVKQSDKKFGKAVMSHGQYIVPALLLRAQARLLVNSTQMVVLLQLLEFWWTVESSAHPSISTIADRIGLTPKQVQRTVDVLVAKNLITKINRTMPGKGKTSNEYKFDGLIAKLKEIEVDFAKARATKKSAGTPGGILANK